MMEKENDIPVAVPDNANAAEQQQLLQNGDKALPMVIGLSPPNVTAVAVAVQPPSPGLLRTQFVRKVFSTVVIMLAVDALISSLPFTLPPMAANNAFLGLVWFVVNNATMYSKRFRRSLTAKILLWILTLLVGLLEVMDTAQYTIHSVLIALAITSSLCFGVALFATISKKDLNSIFDILFIATMGLQLFGLVVDIGKFASQSILLPVVYAAIDVFLSMGWLAIYIQNTMGGRAREYSLDEHIFAVSNIYCAALEIFGWFLWFSELLIE